MEFQRVVFVNWRSQKGGGQRRYAKTLRRMPAPPRKPTPSCRLRIVSTASDPIEEAANRARRLSRLGERRPGGSLDFRGTREAASRTLFSGCFP